MVSTWVPSGVPVAVLPVPVAPDAVLLPFRLLVEATVPRAHPPVANVAQHNSSSNAPSLRVRAKGTRTSAANATPLLAISTSRDARTLLLLCAVVVTVSPAEPPGSSVAG